MKTVVDGLEDEVEAVRELRDSTLLDVTNEYNSLVDERQNKTRLVKNNKYYEKRYAALSRIMIRLTIIIAIFTLLIWANNRGLLRRKYSSNFIPCFNCIFYFLHFVFIC